MLNHVRYRDARISRGQEAHVAISVESREQEEGCAGRLGLAGREQQHLHGQMPAEVFVAISIIRVVGVRMRVCVRVYMHTYHMDTCQRRWSRIKNPVAPDNRSHALSPRQIHLGLQILGPDELSLHDNVRRRVPKGLGHERRRGV